MKKRLWLALSLFVVGALVLAACRPATPPPPTFSGTATITFVQEPDNLNPLYTEMWFSQITREFWLKGLWSFDDNGDTTNKTMSGQVVRGGKFEFVKILGE